MEVVIVCAGAPGCGMGWYHATQLLDRRCPSARLVELVQLAPPPTWFSSPGADQPEAQLRAAGVRVLSAVDQISPRRGRFPKMGLLVPRAAEACEQLEAVLRAGVSHLYLEQPSPVNRGQLERMAQAAAERGVPLMVGYSKNAAESVSRALRFEAGRSFGRPGQPLHVALQHCDQLEPDELLSRGGCLAVLGSHELMLLNALWALTIESIDRVEPDTEFSLRLTGDDGRADYQRLGFNIRQHTGRQLRVQLDRCAGSFSTIELVGGPPECKSVFGGRMPTAEHQAAIPELERRMPGLASHLYQQDPEYASLKERFAKHALDGKPGCPPGLATIQNAIEVMKLVEYLGPILDAAIPSKAPS